MELQTRRPALFFSGGLKRGLPSESRYFDSAMGTTTHITWPSVAAATFAAALYLLITSEVAVEGQSADLSGTRGVRLEVMAEKAPRARPQRTRVAPPTAADCGRWKCTCQGMSDTFGTTHGRWRLAGEEPAAIRFWLDRSCRTTPRKLKVGDVRASVNVNIVKAGTPAPPRHSVGPDNTTDASCDRGCVTVLTDETDHYGTKFGCADAEPPSAGQAELEFGKASLVYIAGRNRR